MRFLVLVLTGLLAAAAGDAPQSLILQLQERIASGDLSGARAGIEKAIRSYPSDGGLYNLLGIVQAQAGELTQARAAFEKSVQLSPKLVGAHLNLARAYEQSGQPALAVPPYRKALTLRPNDAATRQHLRELLGGLAQSSYAGRDLEGALGYLANARDLTPEDAAIHFFFGIVCVELDLPAEASKSLARAVELAPEQPYYRYALGAVNLQSGDPNTSLPHFEAYRKAKPDDTRGRFALGLALFQAGRIEEAEREFTAIAGDPQTAGGANYYLGRIARSDGDMEKAQRHFEAALVANPNHVECLAELGLVYLRLDREEDARQQLEKAITLEPDNRTANRNLYVLYQHSKDPRAEAQRLRLAALEKKRDAEKIKLLRGLEIRPY